MLKTAGRKWRINKKIITRLCVRFRDVKTRCETSSRDICRRCMDGVIDRNFQLQLVRIFITRFRALASARRVCAEEYFLPTNFIRVMFRALSIKYCRNLLQQRGKVSSARTASIECAVSNRARVGQFSALLIGKWKQNTVFFSTGLLNSNVPDPSQSQ